MLSGHPINTETVISLSLWHNYLHNTLLRIAIMYRSAGSLPSHLRQSSLSASNSQTSALQQRINEKRAELENLKQLRELSAGLAGQMEQLEEKLSTLSDGTQGS